ncbi:hypothetical protein EYF80_000656 [Liparis tanakae]|uniref:Uncharacterized protein n=1 Tax=Liparis tanakae TaxID=230148 RepID=A0A4Z2JIB9_9TELE|nr:hypothetical protein EYF80_000656 [Liparis tanakae]
MESFKPGGPRQVRPVAAGEPHWLELKPWWSSFCFSISSSFMRRSILARWQSRDGQDGCRGSVVFPLVYYVEKRLRFGHGRRAEWPLGLATWGHFDFEGWKDAGPEGPLIAMPLEGELGDGLVAI